MSTGTSLLLTLLTTDEANKIPVTLEAFASARASTAVRNASDTMENVKSVVNTIPSLAQGGTPNLVKNVAQRKLYEVLYEIIEKEYEKPEPEPETLEGLKKAQEAQKLNRTLTGAI